MESLINKLKAMGNADQGLITLLSGLFVSRFFRKGAILCMPGQVLHALHFVDHGLVRGYFSRGREEHTSWILENGFINLSSGIFSRSVSTEYVAFLKDTLVYSLDLALVKTLAEKETRLIHLIMEICEEKAQERIQTEELLRIGHAEDRYLAFREFYERLLDLPIHDITASLMNIEPKYLYKIKKKYLRL
jgi:signal-transduction protein with cAMP-binding, CBS, and nucleotidyltransferase domain